MRHNPHKIKSESLLQHRVSTPHSHKPPDWIWALAEVRPGHQTSDCALASLAVCLAACAGRTGAGAPRDRAATSLHKRKQGKGVGYLSEDGFMCKVGQSVWVRGFDIEVYKEGDSREMGEG